MDLYIFLLITIHFLQNMSNEVRTVVFTKEDIDSCSYIKDGQTTFNKYGPKRIPVVETLEVYSIILRRKLREISGNQLLFTIDQTHINCGRKRMVCYPVCEHDVSMPVSYAIADHNLGEPLEMTWILKCKTCSEVIVDFENLSPEKRGFFYGF